MAALFGAQDAAGGGEDAHRFGEVSKGELPLVLSAAAHVLLELT
jgi:hypothetical protein